MVYHVIILAGKMIENKASHGTQRVFHDCPEPSSVTIIIIKKKDSKTKTKQNKRKKKRKKKTKIKIKRKEKKKKRRPRPRPRPRVRVLLTPPIMFGKEITPVTVANSDLGLYLDQSLTYNDHITAANCLQLVHRIKHLLDKETVLLLINSFIFSKLFYCSTV